MWQIVVTARNQAQALSTDFRNLQSLLESVPTFGEPLQVGRHVHYSVQL